jgi:nitroimidazol reductase NimA-like FMN-containing flavoprotein (pyridoxamine 5'-phosphate oxidase superfamily)
MILMTIERQLRNLDRAESLRRLAAVPVGRVVFTWRALPAIRPVNHLLDGDEVIIRTHLGAALVAAGEAGMVVAYEADELDAATRRGWSVVVVGAARLVEPADARRYTELLRPWVHMPMDQVVRIHCEIVNGYELVDAVTGTTPSPARRPAQRPGPARL